MTQEQILEILRNLKATMDYTVNDNEDYNRYQEWNDIEDKIEVIKREIATLQIKLQDDNNYPNFNFTQSRAKIKEFEEKINSFKEEYTNNEDKIIKSTSRIEELDNEIKAAENLINETMLKIEDLGKQIRDLGENIDPQIESELSEKLSNERESLEYLKGELALYNDERENLVSLIETLKVRNQIIPSRLERMESLKKSQEEQMTEIVDLSKKRLDEAKLSDLYESLEQLKNRRDYISSDANEVLTALIAEIELGTISEENIISFIEEIKEKLQATYNNIDYEEYDKKVQQIHDEEVELANKIALLETKLMDDINYTPSLFEVEVIDKEIEELKKSLIQKEEDIKKLDGNIKDAERLIKRYNREIDRTKEEIDRIQKENDDIRFMMTDERLTPEDISSLAEQCKENNARIEKLRGKIESKYNNISNKTTLIDALEKDKESLEKTKKLEENEYDYRRERLEDKKKINKLAMLEDIKELELLRSRLYVLKLQEQMLNGRPIEILDSILNSYNLQNNVVNQPVIENVNNMFNNPEMVELTPLENNDIDLAEPQIALDNNNIDPVEPQIALDNNNIDPVEPQITLDNDNMNPIVSEPIAEASKSVERNNQNKKYKIIKCWKDSALSLRDKLNGSIFINKLKAMISKVFIKRKTKKEEDLDMNELISKLTMYTNEDLIRFTAGDIDRLNQEPESRKFR